MTPNPRDGAPAAHKPTRRWPWLLVLLVLAGGAGAIWSNSRHAGHGAPGMPGASGAGGMPRGAGFKLPPAAVTVAEAREQTVPVWLSALGTVTPYVLANVVPRVAGLLQSVDFHQGEQVRAGQLLATIDPRPFRIAVAQAQAVREQTAAQLAGAQRDLQRYETLLKQDAISAQQVSDQRATVAQLSAQLDANRAALDSARLQLQWTRITAPVSGVAGLRQVDPGNMVSTSGALGAGSSSSSGSAGGSTQGSGSSGAAPIVTIAQVHPIQVGFALPQTQVGELLRQLAAGRHPKVQAWDAARDKLLAEGTLLAADNQISSSTGTLGFRARFDNDRLALYPNQFVNVRVLERSIEHAVMVPSTAVAVGAGGDYVYVLGKDGRVSSRHVVTGVRSQDLTQLVSGVQAGERVVTAGLDHLRDGAQVRVVSAQASAPAARGASRPQHKASAPAPAH